MSTCKKALSRHFNDDPQFHKIIITFQQYYGYSLESPHRTILVSTHNVYLNGYSLFFIQGQLLYILVCKCVDNGESSLLIDVFFLQNTKM